MARRRDLSSSGSTEVEDAANGALIGVWLAESYLDAYPFAPPAESRPGTALLAVNLRVTAAHLRPHQLERTRRPYRVFVVPAALANRGRPRLQTAEDEARLLQQVDLQIRLGGRSAAAARRLLRLFRGNDRRRRSQVRGRGKRGREANSTT